MARPPSLKRASQPSQPLQVKHHCDEHSKIRHADTHCVQIGGTSHDEKVAIPVSMTGAGYCVTSATHVHRHADSRKVDGIVHIKRVGGCTGTVTAHVIASVTQAKKAHVQATTNDNIGARGGPLEIRSCNQKRLELQHAVRADQEGDKDEEDTAAHWDAEDRERQRARHTKMLTSCSLPHRRSIHAISRRSWYSSLGLSFLFIITPNKY